MILIILYAFILVEKILNLLYVSHIKLTLMIYKIENICESFLHNS